MCPVSIHPYLLHHAQEHRDCVTIKTRFRPVPLHWHFAYTAPPPRGVQVTDLLTPNQKALNPRLSQRAVIMEEAKWVGLRGGAVGAEFRADLCLVVIIEEAKGLGLRGYRW